MGRTGSIVSHRVPASEVLHVFKPDRPGQVSGPSWFSSVILTLKDFDEYADATLMKQKIAACLAVFVTDVDGSGNPAVGVKDATKTPEEELLVPGSISYMPPGRDIKFADPPRVNEHAAYSQITLRAIATGFGVTYEDLTGDYTNLPFSAARMSRLRHWARVEDWRWLMLVPQFLNPVWAWAMEAAEIAGLPFTPATTWTAPPLPMIEPDKEGLAIQRNIRTGITTLSEAIRERGYQPEKFLQELADDFRKLDALELVLDCDPRKVSQAGLTQGRPAGTVLPDPNATGGPAPAAGGATGGAEEE
jgi:lambda family phage portal protein